MKALDLSPLMIELDTELTNLGGFLIEESGYDGFRDGELVFSEASWDFPHLDWQVELGIYQREYEGNVVEGKFFPNLYPKEYRLTVLGNETLWTQEWKVIVTIHATFPKGLREYRELLPKNIGVLKGEREEVDTTEGDKVLRKRFCTTGQNKSISLILFGEFFVLLNRDFGGEAIEEEVAERILISA